MQDVAIDFIDNTINSRPFRSFCPPYAATLLQRCCYLFSPFLLPFYCLFAVFLNLLDRSNRTTGPPYVNDSSIAREGGENRGRYRKVDCCYRKKLLKIYIFVPKSSYLCTVKRKNIRLIYKF